MRAGLGWILIAALILSAASSARAQSAAYSEKLVVQASSASTWVTGNTNVVQLRGPVTITLDEEKCQADQAVIWLTPAPGGLLREQMLDIVLIGNARLAARENHLTRTGPTLLIDTIVRGTVQLTAAANRSENLSQSPLYLQAQSIRMASQMMDIAPATQEPNQPPSATRPAPPAPGGGTNAAGIVQPGPGKAGYIRLGIIPLVQEIRADDGTRAWEISGRFSFTESFDNGDFIEFSAQDVVLFTDEPAGGATSSPTDLGHHYTAAYLEGDVRVNYLPTVAKSHEQRLTADRVYYDFLTQQAVLTGVVFHAVDPASQIPFTVRARMMKQIAHGEFAARHVQFTTSYFAVPTFNIRSTYAYIHQEPEDTSEYDIVSHNDIGQVFGIPVFYWPGLWGTFNDKPIPLRNFSFGNSSRYGFTVDSDWGLFETLGQAPPKDLDVSFPLDYYSLRGYGGGIDGTYKGGFITDSAEPWDFQGALTTYIMEDRGVDELGGLRDTVTPPTDLRGRFLWEHQHFLPDDWQVQVRLGYLSDPTFLEEYYQSEFDNTLPYDGEFYAKRQRDTEVLTFLAETDTTNFITDADRQQEQFDVARLPEITYQRIGDSFADDHLTLYSNNSASALKFDQSSFSLEDQGYPTGLSPGLPSDGLTGLTNDFVYRGDTRQEVDWPFSLGQFKFVPYVMGRVTAYSTSPAGDGQTRLYDSAGLRLTTSFWHVDDSIDSDLLDLHRIRHIIQPEVNLFTSGTTVDQNKLYDFDSNVDAITDITAATIALHQHWETMRGGPGRWQSVDLLDVNLEGDFYPHPPPPPLLNPVSFRGLFFPSEPETSVPRQALNADLTWHIDDDTAFLSDVQWNLDTHETAIAEAGLAINRGARLSYYVGDTYIQALETQLFSFNATYSLTSKYSLALNEALNLGPGRAAVTYIALTRRFDVFAFSVSAYHDGINKVSGFNVNFFPSGQPGFSTPWRVNQ
ncbi:MAG: LPS assembly protein LptD [Tepidisphaeraceae bacterium]|jgi:lipopolysaccharide export system protein LptA